MTTMFNFLNRRKKDPEAVIQEIFGDCEVPSFPAAVMEILSILRDPSTSANDLVHKIERDAGLSIKVLGTVNSAAFGLSNGVRHIAHAVNLLGRSRLESIVVSVAVNASLPSEPIGSFDYTRYWRTATRRACLARLLAHRLHPESEVESFTAGLLQDMGVLLLLLRRKDEYARLYQSWQEEPSQALDRLELESIGYAHTDVGAVIARAWGLPGYLIDAVGRHHDSDPQCSIEPAIQLVSCLKDSPADDGRHDVLQQGKARFTLQEEELSPLIERAYEYASLYQNMLAA